ncbi:hypothetical protein WJX81_003684 [Elliptochloris bilobata]|uniref:Uncharacterized protein n=1 Tax=Elliptochloris bilobata TaxID=381761 RepID=A0AAW1S0F5_9CHLO
MALAAITGLCLVSKAAGQSTFDAGSQLPDASNSATLREAQAMIYADPVDVQISRAVAPATGPALTAVRNDPLLSTTLAATLGLNTPTGKLSELVLPGVVKGVGTFLLTNNKTR